ncbi:MAG: hypothetical protein EOP19_19900 [Hyphomicrobiales bacterium]|nr:MAG: hypothetical protein EOP19_19900 [Hyphomicrobiales bacterium]
MTNRSDSFDPGDLRRVERGTHEEIIAGDFVTLASGSPIGIVKERTPDTATVVFLTADPFDMTLPWVCFRQVRDDRVTS